MTQDIQQWLQQVRAAGLSDSAIQEKLVESGWKDYQAAALLQQQVPASSPATNNTAPNQNTKKSHSRRTLITILSVTLGILILGGVAFAGWKGVIPLPGMTKPEKLLEKSFAALKTVQGGEFTFFVDALTEPLTPAAATYSDVQDDAILVDLPNPLRIHASISSFARAAEGQDLKTLFKNAKGMVKIQGEVTLGGSSFRGDLELRVINEKLYLFAGTLPYIPIADLSDFTGKWYVVDLANNPLLNTFTSEVTGSTLGNTNAASDAMLQDVQNEGAAFLKIGLREKAITLKVNGKETLDGVSATRIDARLVPDRWANFKSAYEQDISARGKQENQTAKGFLQVLNVENEPEFVAAAQAAVLSVWVEGKTNMPRKLQFTSLVALPKKAGQADRQFNLSMGVMLAHINEEPNVEAPTNATPIEDALQEILSGPRAEARNSQRQAAIRQLYTALSLYYDTNNTYPKSLEELVVDNQFISRLPELPTPEDSYAYTPDSNVKGYKLCTKLEVEGSEGRDYCIEKHGGLLIMPQ